jgi:hypothetical protein
MGSLGLQRRINADCDVEPFISSSSWVSESKSTRFSDEQLLDIAICIGFAMSVSFFSFHKVFVDG